MTYTLSFRIRREYFEQILQGVKDREVRRRCAFWDSRVAGAAAAKRAGEDLEGVFLCGPDVHRRRVTGIKLEPSAAVALGRQPSEQGLKDVGDGQVYAFLLGPVV